MQRFAVVALVAFALSEALSLAGLWLGERMIGNPLLRRLGARSHAQKMRSLDRVWPLTRIRPAIRSGAVSTLVAIVTSLVALKSVASFVAGAIAVFWLPIASLIVPTIVAAEDPDDPALLPWVRGVARLQVTSHVAAAAIGFALTIAGPLAGRPLIAVLRENAWVVATGLLVSAAFAWAAGRREALGLARRGI